VLTLGSAIAQAYRLVSIVYLTRDLNHDTILHNVDRFYPVRVGEMPTMSVPSMTRGQRREN